MLELDRVRSAPPSVGLRSVGFFFIGAEDDVVTSTPESLRSYPGAGECTGFRDERGDSHDAANPEDVDKVGEDVAGFSSPAALSLPSGDEQRGLLKSRNAFVAWANFRGPAPTLCVLPFIPSLCASPCALSL
jgi:hypothetical protein